MSSTQTPHLQALQKTSIQWRITSQALILTAFVIVVLTTLSFIIARTMLERSVRTQLSSVATIAEDSLERTLQSHQVRASLLTAHEDVQKILSGTFDPRTLDRLLVRLQRDQSALIGIAVYDTSGQTVASAGSAVDLPAEAKNLPLRRPVVTDAGWELYDVFTPIWETGGAKTGYISLRYDISPALQSLLVVAPSMGDTAEVVLVMNRSNEVQLLHPSLIKSDAYVLSLGEASGISSAVALVRSLKGQEGVARSQDYRGRDSLVAYRYLPALGWGLAIQVERKAALADVRRMATAHASIGTLLLILAATLASLLAHQLTQPLRQLTERVGHLRPGAWGIKRSVQTGDEVEVLDTVVVDMASRLKAVYEKQEGIIEERTEELQKQYVLDRAILQSIEYGVITVDTQGIITGANPAAVALLMQRMDALAGKDVTMAVPFCSHGGKPLEGKHPVHECLLNAKTMRPAANGHISIRRPDDSLLPVMFAVSPLQEGGKTFGAILAFQDISEERRLDYLKSEFITLASHQLRTPLSALRWYVELFGEEAKALSKDQRGYLKEMERSITRMVALLNSLLHAAHLEGDNLEPEIHSVNVSQLMTELNDDCKQLVHEAGLQCSINMPKKKVTLETDETLLRIVLQNLMNNAVKYTPAQTNKLVHFALEDSKTDVKIKVSDEGWGIPKAEQSRIFQKFFRAKNIRKYDTDGNGLGLYITRTIVERLGGTIVFESAENKGTTFTVTLPKTKTAKKTV